MRRILLIAVAALLTTVGAKAQQSPQAASGTEGLACFENLAAPEYPKKALQAHVDGSVWTWTGVNAQGAIDKIETQVVSAWSQGEKLLPPAVEKANRAANIKPECWGKKVLLVFRYQLHGDATTDPKVTSRNEAPNIVYIESQPALPAEAAAKLPSKP